MLVVSADIVAVLSVLPVHIAWISLKRNDQNGSPKAALQMQHSIAKQTQCCGGMLALDGYYRTI
jgi:hypothetical protein